MQLADTYRTDELSYVRATLKQQLTDRYRCRTDISRSRNRALVYGSSVSIMARLPASRQVKAASDSRLYARVVCG